MSEIKASPIVETAKGKVQGQQKNNILAYKGIPFAAPPVGDLRWMPPEDVKPWTGILDASDYGDWAPQNKSMLDDVMGAETRDQSEDCLSLNIWTPGVEGKRPVMVWLHGGGFTIGAGSQGIYEGQTLANHGDVVVVTINYRLGILGFAHLDSITNGSIPSTGNEGLLDQAKALAWVKENISSFGGDPNNVTIFGESAGGMSTGALLALPKAKGLFHKAIPQSGACHTYSALETAQLQGEAILQATGWDTDGLRNASFAELMKAQRYIESGKVEGYPLSKLGSLPFVPVADGQVLPNKPFEAVEQGFAADIPIMAGSTLDEWKLFGLPARSIRELDEENMNRRLGYLIGQDYVPGLVDAYREALPERGTSVTPSEIFMAIQTDRIFRIPAIRLLERQKSHNSQVYNYLFDWLSPAAGGAMGSPHAVELAYVFGTHTKPGAKKFYGEGPGAVALATMTMDAWTSFARDGNPGWQAYDTADRATAILGDSLRINNAPFDAERQAWQDVPDAYLGSL